MKRSLRSALLRIVFAGCTCARTKQAPVAAVDAGSSDLGSAADATVPDRDLVGSAKREFELLPGASGTSKLSRCSTRGRMSGRSGSTARRPTRH